MLAVCMSVLSKNIFGIVSSCLRKIIFNLNL